jgi:hemerythrin-like domain-containing protein
MIPITRVLAAEHKMFCAVFDQIEQTLPQAQRLDQLRGLSRFVEELLRSHAGAEEDLVLLAVDHGPEHKRRCHRFHQEHQEIDGRITRVQTAKDIAQARGLLQAAMLASRKHFEHEERVIFPLIERLTKHETLTKMGALWLRRRHMMGS